MATEIERKFLVEGDFLSEATSKTRIVQGYICSEKGRTVRVRIRDDKGYLTVKGAASSSGLSRYEFEREVPLEDAEQMLRLCEQESINKERYLVPYKGHTWEVDVFHGHNEGLILAEIELSREDEPFERPSWLGKEVTGDRRYYNSVLTRTPFHIFEEK
ncbi:MAG: CYTH domain-containing protein [Parabacteroides sp.]|nr:CYTH domain-containing protein [Parabacteroides sp.]MDD6080130.1 CYTH domain-containing protein [bacterium]MCI7007953.1 CYTH domain-containing protein [Parabacteroides sp.]MCI7781920.1 CYTH domain-containing protein [Parabacteroides sp.]MDD7061778.1 CYTH domain-containing protein [bacterium]